MRFLRTMLIAFWSGQSGLYLIQWVRYDDIIAWLDSFNNPMLLVPIYLLSLGIGFLVFRYGRNHGGDKSSFPDRVAGFWDKSNKRHSKEQGGDSKQLCRNPRIKKGR